MKRLPVFAAALLLAACTKAPPPTGIEYPQEKVEAPVSDSGYSTVLYAVVKAGKSSGVVGVSLDQVAVTLRYGDKSVGPVLTDPSGGVSVDAMALFPEGTPADGEALAKIEPINVEVHLERAGYRPGIEIVTFPVERYKEFTFFLKGEGQ